MTTSTLYIFNYFNYRILWVNTPINTVINSMMFKKSYRLSNILLTTALTLDQVIMICGLVCQKQVSRAGTDNFLPTDTVGCNYLSLPLIPASGTQVINCLWMVYRRLVAHVAMRDLAKPALKFGHGCINEWLNAIIVVDVINYPYHNTKQILSVMRVTAEILTRVMVIYHLFNGILFK